MKKLFFLFLLTSLLLPAYSQVQTREENRDAVRDSLQAFGQREVAEDSLEIHTPEISNYTYWRSPDLKPSVVDTTLTIQSFYDQNFTQKDQFGNMYFPNFGQTFNPLIYRSKAFRLQLLPTGKSFNYLYPDQIRYYNVKTPMTEFVYENGLREGQYLSTTFTQNLGPNFNYSVRYRGLRSSGRYRNNLAANNAFIATINFQTKNKRFGLWTHYASQNINDDENAGIEDLNEFENDDEMQTTNRQNIRVNLKDAYTKFDSRRFLLGADYRLLGRKPSDTLTVAKPLILKNVFVYEKQKYLYAEPQPEDYYASSVFGEMERRNLLSFETLTNTSTVEFKWGERMLLEAGVLFESLKLFSPQSLDRGLVHIPGSINDNLLGGTGRFMFDWNEKIKLNAEAEFKSGDIYKNQYYVKGVLSLQPLAGYFLEGGAVVQSAFPSLNLYYHQSFYKDFNYYNYSFDNVNTQQLFGRLKLDRIRTTVEGNLYNVENYVFVNRDFRPQQVSSGISLFQIKTENLISWQKFNLMTTLEYQKVTQNKDLLPLPDFVGRASLYWQSPVFENKAEMQVGINVSYFTEFKSREFFPVINEFMLQRENPDFGIQKIGNFPIFDIFLNLKVDRMRIYIRADHINSTWGKNNYYSAPFVPFRDFKFQFGVKWYLFT